MGHVSIGVEVQRNTDVEVKRNTDGDTSSTMQYAAIFKDCKKKIIFR